MFLELRIAQFILVLPWIFHGIICVRLQITDVLSVWRGTPTFLYTRDFVLKWANVAGVWQQGYPQKRPPRSNGMTELDFRMLEPIEKGCAWGRSEKNNGRTELNCRYGSTCAWSLCSTQGYIFHCQTSHMVHCKWSWSFWSLMELNCALTNLKKKKTVSSFSVNYLHLQIIITAERTAGYTTREVSDWEQH